MKRPYFTSKDITIIVISAAFWSVLNITLAPLFWSLTHLPFFCDMLAIISLFLSAWWTKRLGAATLTGIIATLLNFVFRPGAVHFLGFTIASFIFDVVSKVVGYERCFSKSGILAVVIAILSTWIAGFIIGMFFLAKADLVVFPLLHAVGGLIGALLGLAIIRGLKNRGITP